MKKLNLNNLLSLVFIITFTLIFLACGDDEDPIVEPPPQEPYLKINLAEVPYDNLSSYGFFTGDIADFNPARGVFPYEIGSTLFSDYASKDRFIYLPEGTSMSYVSDYDVLDMPVGTIIVKNFTFFTDERNPSLGKRIIETRLLVREEDEWKPYEYQWNDGMTDASRLIVGTTVSASTILIDGTAIDVPDYVLPRELDCRTCHKFNEELMPIGPKPSNLNIVTSNSGGMTQLARWTSEGLLSGVPSAVEIIPNYSDASLSPITRGRAYLDANCSFCHREGGTANANGLYINWDYSGPELNQGIFKIPTNYNAANLQYDIVPGNPEQSILWFRMTLNTAPDIMPQLGRSINHKEGIDIIRTYIENL